MINIFMVILLLIFYVRLSSFLSRKVALGIMLLATGVRVTDTILEMMMIIVIIIVPMLTMIVISVTNL